jgi:hypothetical protein
MSKLALAGLVAALIATSLTAASAGPGVGVSPGVISVNDRLKPGGAYDLPALGVVNTGDVTHEYEVNVTHLERQTQRRPDEGWFSFSPGRFVLEPGQSEPVSIRLVLPTGAAEGEYFAHLEAHPILGADQSVGVAAATKLSFTVDESTWFAAQRVRFNRWLDDASPWLYVGAAAALVAFLAYRYRDRYRLRSPIERK